MIFNTDLTTQKQRISDFLYHCEYQGNEWQLSNLIFYRFKPKYKNKVMIDLETCTGYKERKLYLVRNRTYRLAFLELIQYFYDNYHILLKPHTIVSDFISDHETTTEPLTLKPQDIELSIYYKNNTQYFTAQHVAFYLGLPLRTLTKYIKLGYFGHIAHLEHNNTRYISIESVLKFQALFRHDPKDISYPVLTRPASELEQYKDEQLEQIEADEQTEQDELDNSDE